MAKKNEVNQSLIDRFSSGYGPMHISPNTPEQQRAVDEINAQQAAKKKAAAKKPTAKKKAK